MRRFQPYRQHLRGLLALGLPLVGSHIAQVLIGVTDAVMLGWYDVQALAAVTISHSIWFVLFIVGSGFAFAVMPLIAQALGEGDETQVRRVTRMGLWLSIFYACAVIPPLIWSEPLLRALGQTPETAALAQAYLRIAAFGLLPGLMVMVLKSYLAALERSHPVLWITVATVFVNAAVNYVLIFGHFGLPELGIRGAAIASLSVHIAGLIGFVIYCLRTMPEHALFVRFWRVDSDALVRVFRLGWPIGVTNLAEVGLFAASSIMMGWLGAIPLAAHGICLQLTSLTFVVHLGLSQAATVRTGAAHGRRDPEGLRLGAQAALLLSAGFALATCGIYLAVPELLVGIFVDPTDPARPEILAIGVVLLALAAVFQLFDGLQVMALGLLRAVHDTRRPMVYAAISYWGIGIPASYVMGFVLGWGAAGVWLGLVLGLALAAVSLLARFWSLGLRRASVRAATPAQ